ncbi:chloride channel protein [Falsihalocynthiibacter sp. SS001]|uniref:chloride channel protein n=1 Tax=Falsihalocynthiibacter sp. SS001 TaxID=3349698 RepID=UPI0036D34AD5
MSQQIKTHIRQVSQGVAHAMRQIRQYGPSQIQFWFIALLIGIAAGATALYFRKGISALQDLLYRSHDANGFVEHVSTLPWYWVVGLPIVGGLVVGVILHRYTPDGRVRSVADVIEGAALHNGRVETREGLASGLSSLITLSSGGSSGREGPVVHLAAVISTWVSNRIHADGITARDLLGCAVAGAVSASFNAPIAGALFALEVVLRHFAVHAFAPIVIAAVAGTVVSRLEFGNVTEFTLLREGELAFYIELPAFLLLGIVCGIVAVVLMKSIFWADGVGTVVQEHLRFPRWLRPAFAGAMLGVIALWFPSIIGVGYETTSAALTGQLLFEQAVIFAIIKTIAVAITMAGRMGGGVFSPAVMIGALTGLAFGIVATGVFPNVSGSETLYALAGMGAVGAAVLGAPISTTLIVFELTGDWQTGLAVMVAVSMSTAIASRLVDKSFFLTLLELRGVHLASGGGEHLLSMIGVQTIVRQMDAPRGADRAECARLVQDGLSVRSDATLETVMPLFEANDVEYLPVRDAEGKIIGAVFHVDALLSYNDSLTKNAAEEHS